MYIHCRFTQTRLCMETRILFYYWERKCKKNREELRCPYDDVVPMKTCIRVEIVSLVQMSGIIFEKMQRMQSGVGLSNKSKVNLEASIDGISKIHWRQSSGAVTISKSIQVALIRIRQGYSFYAGRGVQRHVISACVDALSLEPALQFGLALV